MTADIFLKELESFIKPGVSTMDIDRICGRAQSVRIEMVPSFKGLYEASRPAACVSVNEEVVHGIPSERSGRCSEGDIVSVDAGAQLTKAM